MSARADSAPDAAKDHTDVLIVGAGISGIGAAYHLQAECPRKTFTILEGRERMGGTWDFFRYPGIRSDSDMYTLGYSFRPWTHEKAIADGATILSYLRDTATTFGIDKKIVYRRRVRSASWSSADARWTIEGDDLATGVPFRRTCSFLFMCAGYYDYEGGYTPELPGHQQFRGRTVHPQRWTPDIEYEGKRVVVIGSGASAVTLVPELAKKAAHVTMLQRSPTYIMSVPARDKIADWLRQNLPKGLAHTLARWKNISISMAFYQACRRYPEQTKRHLIGMVEKAMGAGTDIATDFTPRYNPWDQRMCLIPDGDLFKAIKDGKASIVTGHIDTFTETGIRLKSGRELAADLVVTATGLKLKFLGGLSLTVDGERVEPNKTMAYKGMMCSGVPNMALAIGYTNASWTLKCDLTSEYVCRLLGYMDAHGYSRCVPVRDPSLPGAPLIDFSSGYIQRAIGDFPQQGPFAPWRVYQNYAMDRMMLKRGRLDDGAMQFSTPNA